MALFRAIFDLFTPILSVFIDSLYRGYILIMFMNINNVIKRDRTAQSFLERMHELYGRREDRREVDDFDVRGSDGN